MIKENKLVDQYDISNLVKTSDLATKAELEAEQDKREKFQTFDSSYFHGKNYFDDD